MKKNFIKAFLLLFMIIIFPKNVSALTFSVNKSADNLKPGSTVTVTINAEVENNANLSAFTLGLAYDGSLINYENGNGANNVNIQGGNGKITMSYNGDKINSNFTVATLNFKVNNINENKTTSLSLSASGVTSDVSARANSANISLLTLGKDATLKSLKIPNATLQPSFNKNTTDYSTEVKDVTEVSVDAVATDSSAKIQISDNYRNLQKGDNLIKIVVTAENGTSKTYNIKVSLDTTPTDEELLKADATLKSLTIKGQKLDFKPDEKKYFLEVPYKTTSLTIEALATNEKAKVEMSSTKLKVGKNDITIKVTSEDGSNNITYDLVITRAEQKKEIVKTCPDTTSSKEWLIYSISMFLIFSIGLTLGYLLKKYDVFSKLKNKKENKKKNKKLKQEKEETEETLSDTIEINPKDVLKQNSKTKK